MPADYESLFKPAGGDDDSPPAEDDAPAPAGENTWPVAEDSPAERNWEPSGDGGAGPMPAAAKAQETQAPAPQLNVGLPPGPPAAARPPVRSWPGMPAPRVPAPLSRGPAVASAPVEGWGAADGDTEATTLVSTQTASDVLKRAMTPAPHPQTYTDGRTEIVNVWPVTEAMASAPEQTSAATIGNHRAIDALSHVDVKTSVKMPSQRGWRHILYMLTRINLGLSPDEIYEMDLHTRIRRNARDSYQIGVFWAQGRSRQDRGDGCVGIHLEQGAR